MLRGLFGLLLLCLGAVPILAADIPDGGTCVPYGRNWAFMMSAPAGWVGECHAERSTGATVAYWPVGSSWGEAASVMYVSVSNKTDSSLAKVIAEDEASFRQRNPEGVIARGDPIKTSDGTPLAVSMTSGLGNGRVEVIAYAEQASVVLIIGMTSRTAADRDLAMAAFRALIGSYMKIDKVEFRGAEPGSH